MGPDVTTEAQAPGRARRALREFISLYWDSGVSNDVPALAWFLASSLVPLALGLTALATVILGDYAQAQALAQRMTGVLPKDVHDQVVELILRTKRDSPLLLAISIVGMVWTASGAIGVVSRVQTRLLARPDGSFVIGKLRNLGLALALAVLVVVMVIAASAGTGLVERLGLNPVVTRVVVPLVALALTVTICAGMYWMLAGRSVRWRSALAGGLVGGVILLVTPTLTGYYLKVFSGRAAVALFLMLAGIFITCYLAALGLLLGAGVTARIDLGHRLGPDAGNSSTSRAPT
jgi:membrane protein